MKPNKYILTSLLLLLVGTGEVSAQSTSDTRVEKLEETVRLLERRVVALEDKLNQRNAAPPVPSDKMNWRKIERGISQGDVEKLLGSPSRVEASVAFTTWYYGVRGRAQVTFSSRNGTVVEWIEP